MNETARFRSANTIDLPANAATPAARPLSDFAVELVGEDLVLLDGETLHYHTLNAAAQQIWRACDGSATPTSIAEATWLPIEVVERAIAELGEAGLLLSPSSQWDARLSRRRATKLIAAGVAGAVGLPLIKSITAPDAASAASNLPDGSACVANSECASACCLDLDGAWETCREWQVPVFVCNQIYRYGQVCSPGAITIPLPGLDFTIPCM